jgi:KaiC/GvpD/RAD55 family RecA-like ATPase
MVKSEIIKQSPLRILDESTHGGVGTGNLGVLAASHGVGKTAALVHIATDKLFQGKHVIHVTFAEKPDHIHSYYEDIFSEISKKRQLEGAMDVHDEIVKNKTIMNFDQKASETKLVLESLTALIEEGHFEAELVIIDEYDFAHASPDDIAQFKAFAQKEKLEVWFSVSFDREDEASFAEKVAPSIKSHASYLDVIVNIRPTEDGVLHLELVKDHGNAPSDMHLILDPNTLLIAREN